MFQKFFFTEGLGYKKRQIFTKFSKKIFKKFERFVIIIWGKYGFFSKIRPKNGQNFLIFAKIWPENGEKCEIFCLKSIKNYQKIKEFNLGKK